MHEEEMIALDAEGAVRLSPEREHRREALKYRQSERLAEFDLEVRGSEKCGTAHVLLVIGTRRKQAHLFSHRLFFFCRNLETNSFV